MAVICGHSVELSEGMTKQKCEPFRWPQQATGLLLQPAYGTDACSRESGGTGDGRRNNARGEDGVLDEAACTGFHRICTEKPVLLA